MVATVVLEHVNAPLSEAVGIIDLMIKRTSYQRKSALIVAVWMQPYSQNLAHVISPALLYMPYFRLWLCRWSDIDFKPLGNLLSSG